MEQFKAILLKPCKGYERCTIVDVVAGGDGFEGRWRVLRPVNLAGSWLVPRVNADRAISVTEAAHILAFRRGPTSKRSTASVRRYIYKGTLAPAGRTDKDIGAHQRVWFVSLEATWKMPLPKARHPKPKKQEGDDV